MPPERTRVVVVGGGIAGMSAAYYLGRAPGEVECTVVEEHGRLGGKIETVHTDGFTIEAGPDSFIARKPDALGLVRDLGLEEQLVPARRGGAVYLVDRGRLVPLPQGMSLIAPLAPGPFLRSPLFSLRGKLRALAEPLVPPRRDAPDESIGSFTRRRFGQELVDRVAEPLMAGIHLGDPDRLSMSTFPHLLELERTHGSVIRGMRRMRRNRPADRGSHAGIPMYSLREGMGSLVKALDAAVGRSAVVRTRTRVTRIERTRTGYRIVLETAGGTPEALEADCVVLAVPASAAAAILRETEREASELLTSFSAYSSATVSLAFGTDAEIPELDGTGFLVPAAEHRTIRGCTFTTNKYPARSPSGAFLLRAFIGGPDADPVLDRSDDELSGLVLEELRDIIGVRSQPRFSRVFRFRHATPQYEVGHSERVARLASLRGCGLHFIGSSYTGSGIPDCTAAGRQVASAVVEHAAAEACRGRGAQ